MQSNGREQDSSRTRRHLRRSSKEVRGSRPVSYLGDKLCREGAEPMQRPQGRSTLSLAREARGWGTLVVGALGAVCSALTAAQHQVLQGRPGSGHPRVKAPGEKCHLVFFLLPS